MNVMHISAECSPFVKVGGLADVVGSLPGELQRLSNMEVRVMLPKYKSIGKNYQKKMISIAEFTVDLGDKKNIYVGVESLKKGNITYYFIDNLFYFGHRDQIYNYGDEAERFAFFQIASLEAMTRIGFVPDIIHVHDWHTAVIPLLLKTRYKGRLVARTVLTIHNLAYQGVFLLQDRELFGIGDDPRLEYEGFLNFLKTGIVTADILTTVSTTYAREILTDYYGYGMQRLLQNRFTSLIGITNGISYREYDPESDKLIERNYSFADYTQGKKENKKYLGRQLDIDFPVDKPLIGIVSRLVNQKGFDLVKRVFDEMLDQDDFYLAVLGDGETEYVEYFKALESRHREQVRVRIGYDNNLAHQIYAASDIFLMPSKFEPCGLGQLIALRYGTIPIVRETGGLVDTVQPYNEYDQTGNGFSFTHFNAHDMMHVIRYALATYHVPQAWDLLVKAAMSANFSWHESAKAYRKIYKRLSK